MIPLRAPLLFPLLLGLSACLGPGGAVRARPVPAREASDGARVFRWPLQKITIRSHFGPRRRGFHTGIDIAQSKKGGDPVLAAAEGVVLEARRQRGYGLQVLLRHGDGWHTRYAHLRSFRVRKGDRVRAGEVLGAVGATGRATGPHLHFEILTPAKKPVDPAPYLFKK